MLMTDIEDQLNVFYSTIYGYSHFAYYKLFLEMENSYSRKTIKNVRAQYNSIVCMKNSKYLSSSERKEIESYLKKTNLNEESLISKMNYMKKEKKELQKAMK